MSDYLLAQDDSSGRVHRRYLDGRTFEADNLDDAGSWHEITPEQALELPVGALCARCFPIDIPGWAESEAGEDDPGTGHEPVEA